MRNRLGFLINPLCRPIPILRLISRVRVATKRPPEFTFSPLEAIDVEALVTRAYDDWVGEKGPPRSSLWIWLQ